jgi:rare lipoprotein A
MIIRCGFSTARLGAAALLAAGLPGAALAQAFAAAPPGRFEAAFAAAASVPTFARPEISELLPEAAVAVPDESTSAPDPAPAAERPKPWRAPVAAARASLTKILHELVIAPAESATSEPPPPASEVAEAPAEAVSPQPETTGSVTTTLLPPRRPQLAARAKPGRRIAVMRAAWYQHSGRTASGDRYDPDGLTAAHRTLPLGSRVLVVDAKTKRSVVVRINDRVPKTAKVPLDLSRGSARAIGLTDVGTVALYEVE